MFSYATCGMYTRPNHGHWGWKKFKQKVSKVYCKAVVDTQFIDTFFLQAQLKYHIFILFKYGSNSCNLLEKLKKCGLEGMSRFPSDFLHEPNQVWYQVGKGCQ